MHLCHGVAYHRWHGYSRLSRFRRLADVLTSGHLIASIMLM